MTRNLSKIHPNAFVSWVPSAGVISLDDITEGCHMLFDRYGDNASDKVVEAEVNQCYKNAKSLSTKIIQEMMQS